jgi:hypothetical protein
MVRKADRTGLPGRRPSPAWDTIATEPGRIRRIMQTIVPAYRTPPIAYSPPVWCQSCTLQQGRTMTPATFVVDGIETIGLHNNLYRIAFFTLSANGKPEKSVELVLGAGPLKEVAKAIQRLTI